MQLFIGGITALFDINTEDDFRYIGASSWSLDGKRIALTLIGQAGNGAFSLSQSRIILIDAVTGNDVQDLTSMGRFYPDFGY